MTSLDTALISEYYDRLEKAEARIRELEQERGAEGTNWFPESFVSQLRAQLQAVTQERDVLRGSTCMHSSPRHNDDIVSRLQARNQELESALRDADATLAPCNCLCDVTRTREIIRAALAHKPSPEVKP